MSLIGATALMLGIFGAVYSAISALRLFFDRFIQNTIASADECVSTASEDQGDSSEHYSIAVDDRKKVKACSVVWFVCHVVPILFFCAVVGYLTQQVIKYWDDAVAVAGSSTLYPAWPWCKTAILWMGITNLVCFVVAIGALVGFWLLGNSIKKTVRMSSSKKAKRDF